MLETRKRGIDRIALIAVAVTILTEAAGGVWWASQVEDRVATVQERIAKIEDSQSHNEARRDDQEAIILGKLGDVVERLARIETSVADMRDRTWRR